MNKMISERLRAARKQSGLTQAQAAERVGITQSHLSMLEKGKRRLSADMAARLCELYGITPEMFGGLFENDTDGKAESALKLLTDLVKKSGSERLAGSADDYIALCAYAFIREIYLANPYNSERAFSLSADKFERLKGTISSEPGKAASFAKQSKEVKARAIEPDETQTSEFLRIIRACEEIADRSLKKQA